MRESFANYMMIKSLFKYCTFIHLALYFSAVICFMPTSSVARVIDQLNETFEFVFSSIPLENYYMLKDATAEAISVQLIVIFFVTAVPSYIIGYPLILRHFKKRQMS